MIQARSEFLYEWEFPDGPFPTGIAIAGIPSLAWA